MELPKVIWLTTPRGERVGAMLLASESGGDRGDCVFISSSKSPAGIESDLGVVISELRASGEHRFTCNSDGTGFRLTVTPLGLPKVHIRLDESFSGGVYTDLGGAVFNIGCASPGPDGA